MSLKAKIEAVIYAAEEPVTLAQLAALFQSEVVEVRETRLSAEAVVRDAAELVEQPHPSAQEPGEGTEHAAESSEFTTPDGEVSAEAVAIDANSDVEAKLEADVSSDQIPAAQEAVEPVPAEAIVPSADDEKRATRQRDREIREELHGILDDLIAEYAKGDRGMEIREIAGGYRVATKPEYHDAVRSFVKSLKPPMKLSLQALETLAVIAYKQPVTAPEVSEIRGVDSGGVLGSLVSRKLITTAGRKQVIGRPILYKTTKEFLLRFGLKDLNELPSIEEFEKMAGELADVEEAPEIAKPELPFQPEEVEASRAAEEDSDEALEIRVEEDAETEAAAVASVDVSDESEAQGSADLPGIESESVVDGEETAVGQLREEDR